MLICAFVIIGLILVFNNRQTVLADNVRLIQILGLGNHNCATHISLRSRLTKARRLTRLTTAALLSPVLLVLSLADLGLHLKGDQRIFHSYRLNSLGGLLTFLLDLINPEIVVVVPEPIVIAVAEQIKHLLCVLSSLALTRRIVDALS